MIIEFFKKNKSFVIYSVIGLSGATMDYIGFIVLHYFFGVDKQIANLVSVNLGIINNFFLNSRFNFKVTDKLYLRFISFYFVGMVNLAIAAIFLYLGTDIFGVKVIISKSFSIIFIMCTGYFLNKKISFKQ